MKTLRHFCGFSLVEMMMLLLITSLMLASGVAVISKKHVKVPKIAMHGAYMCYYKDGQLHEEQYVGTVKSQGQNKKILDRDVTECRFKPPGRVSYLYIQATAGGGGGGDSGYKGGNLQKFTSAVDKISPFGINQTILDLKGFNEGELVANGGTIEAWAHGADESYGDAGGGGDVYYIEQNCAGSGTCIVHREWEYTGTQERDCSCDTGTINSTKKNYDYTYTCGQSSYSSSTCNRNKYEPYGVFNFNCTGYGDKYEYCYSYSSCEDGYTRLSGANRETESCTYPSSGCTCSHWDYNVKYDPYECGTKENPKTCYHYKDVCTDAWRYTGRFDYGRKTVTDKDNCTSCTWDETCSGSCYIETDIPTGASCSLTGQKDLVVQTEDTYAADYDSKPHYGQLTDDINASNPVNSSSNKTDYTGKSEDDLMKIREVWRQPKNATYSYTLCNYGNPSLFTGGDGLGTFGSSALGWDNNIASCSSADVLEAFGEGIIPLGGGEVSRSYGPVKQPSTDFYNTEIKYNIIEEIGLAAFFGTDKICTNAYNGTCEPKKTVDNSSSYRNPITGTTTNNKKPLYTQCYFGGTNAGTTSSSSSSTGYTQNGSRDTCASASSGKRDFSKSYTGTVYPGYTINTKCYCKQKNPKSSGSECLYSYGDVTDENVSCYYKANVVEGGTPGKGKNCSFSSGAGVGLTYKGRSDIIPGIRGYDKICMSKYRPLYTKSDWENQAAPCYAQNGSDSQGSAEVMLNGQSCTVHSNPPKLGKGARRKGSVRTSIPTPGSAEPNGNGADGDGGNSTSVPACAAGGPHVGYCVKGVVDYKYSYTYTWNTNYLQYGEGGKAGGYNVKLIRSVKDGEFQIELGKGGAGGAVGSGASGENGGDTIISFIPEGGTAGDPLLTVLGGAGGPGGLVGNTEQLPRYHQDGTFVAGMNGTAGESASLSNVKSNIMNLVLPVADDNILNQWLMASGAGGDGGGSTNNCWASEWHREFEGVNVVGDWGPAEEEDVACRHGANENNYYSATPAAQDGVSGVVVISW